MQDLEIAWLSARVVKSGVTRSGVGRGPAIGLATAKLPGFRGASGSGLRLAATG